jgi:hypothetical protein
MVGHRKEPSRDEAPRRIGHHQRRPLSHGFCGFGGPAAQRSADHLADPGEGHAGERFDDCDRLEQRGLVVRTATSADRRARIVELTLEGKQIATAYFERHAKDLEALMSVLSAEEKHQLYASPKTLGLYAVLKLNQAQETARNDIVGTELEIVPRFLRK